MRAPLQIGRTAPDREVALWAGFCEPDSKVAPHFDADYESSYLVAEIRMEAPEMVGVIPDRDAHVVERANDLGVPWFLALLVMRAPVFFGRVPGVRKPVERAPVATMGDEL